jgi:hypothetical protein
MDQHTGQMDTGKIRRAFDKIVRKFIVFPLPGLREGGATG